MDIKNRVTIWYGTTRVTLTRGTKSGVVCVRSPCSVDMDLPRAHNWRSALFIRLTCKDLAHIFN